MTFFVFLFGVAVTLLFVSFVGVVVFTPKVKSFYLRYTESQDTPSVSFSLDPTYYPVPRRAHPHDAGLDLSVAENKIIEPGQIATLDTGIRMAIPKGYAGFLCLRSSFARNNPDLCLINNIGVIDSGYTGNIMAVFENVGSGPCHLYRGDRFAQLVIVPCLLGSPKFAAALEKTERGDGGFGSTGK